MEIAIERLNKTVEDRDAMIEKILYCGKLNLHTDSDYNRKEKALRKKSYINLVKIIKDLEL